MKVDRVMKNTPSIEGIDIKRGGFPRPEKVLQRLKIVDPDVVEDIRVIWDHAMNPQRSSRSCMVRHSEEESPRQKPGRKMVSNANLWTNLSGTVLCIIRLPKQRGSSIAKKQSAEDLVEERNSCNTLRSVT